LSANNPKNKNTEKGEESMKFKPLKDRVFVKYTEEGEKTAGGLYIPDSAKEKPQKGLVEAVGSEVKEVKVGNTILFDKYSGSKVNIDSNEYLIIKEEDILGIVEG
jgi:chaperonin GroES